ARLPRPTARRVAVAGLLVAAFAVDWGCAATPPEPSTIAPTPCPGLAGWPPVGRPLPPATLEIRHDVAGEVAVVNHGPDVLRATIRVWTPGECGRMSTGEPDLFGPFFLLPG